MMYLNLSKFLFLLVIFGGNHVNTSPVTDLIKESIGRISFFFPNSSMVFGGFLKIWETLEKIDALIKPKDTVTMEDKVNDIQNKVKQILREVRHVDSALQEKVIIMIPEEINLDSKMKVIEYELDQVDIWFDNYIDHINPLRPYENDTIAKFVDDLIGTDENFMVKHLSQVSQKLKVDFASNSVLSTFGHKKLAKEMMCKRQQSSLHALNQLRIRILLTEVKGLVITGYAFGKKRQFTKNQYVHEMKTYIENCFERVHNYQILFKYHMSRVPSAFWLCDSAEHTEGDSYFKLGPIFNSYFMPPLDAAKLDGSAVRQITKSTTDCGIKEAFDACTSSFCAGKHNKKCRGIVRDCQPIGDNKVDICIKHSSELKRYTYVKYHDHGTLYGKNETCPYYQLIEMDNKWMNNFLEKKHNLYSKDGLCFCTCDEEYDITADRYFSLMPVTSDVKDNKVVLGVKLEKLNKVFYIKIKQGQLIADGLINETSVEWKPINILNVFNKKHTKEGTDFYRVTWNKRTVNLDNLISPVNCTVTGLKFVQKGDNLALSLQYTSFDFKTGKLDQSSHWFSKDDGGSSRNPIHIDTELPSDEIPNYTFSKDESSIQFTVSDFESDLGENVVPFIEGREISSEPPSLLNGAGLMHRGGLGSSGYLSMKLFTYGFSNNIQIQKETIDTDKIVSKIFKE